MTVRVWLDGLLTFKSILEIHIDAILKRPETILELPFKSILEIPANSSNHAVSSLIQLAFKSILEINFEISSVATSARVSVFQIYSRDSELFYYVHSGGETLSTFKSILEIPCSSTARMT